MVSGVRRTLTQEHQEAIQSAPNLLAPAPSSSSGHLYANTAEATQSVANPLAPKASPPELYKHTDTPSHENLARSLWVTNGGFQE